MQYLIMCRSLTQAERAAKLLDKNGINAVIIKAPQGLHTQGCAYAVSLNRRFDEAVLLLKKNNLIKGKVFFKTEQGEYREAEL